MKKIIFLFIAIFIIFISILLVININKNLKPEEVKNSNDSQTVVNAPSTQTPSLLTETLIDNLNNPWDIGFIDANTFVFTLKEGEVQLSRNSELLSLGAIPDVVSRGEGGLMGLAIDSNFKENKYIYFCLNSSIDGLDVRVIRFELDLNTLSLADRKDIVTGLPSNPSGRHSGCQLEFSENELWIGTGDAAQSSHPQDPKSLGGKILRVDREGNGISGNLDGEFDSKIFSYGHRNTQGISIFPENEFGLVGVSSEHGSNIDDELNPLVKGNFGWDPNPPYIENVSMTDLTKFPDAIESIWSSGSPTTAAAGVTLIKGEQWLTYNNSIAIANLKTAKVLILKIDNDLNITQEFELFKNEFGRIRTIQQGLDGNLYLLTSNGKAQDKIIKVSTID